MNYPNSINGHDVAIAEARNDLRMVWPLFLACYLFAFLTPMRPWIRVGVLAASPAIAVVGNVLRLVPTVWVYGHWDAHAAQIFHDVGGWVMLVVSFLALMGIARAFRWALPAPQGRQTPRTAPSSTAMPARLLHRFLAVSSTLILLSGAAREAWSMPVEADAASYHQLVVEAASRTPIRIGSWLGRDVPMDEPSRDALQPNLVISREYADSQTGRKAKVLLVQVSDARRLPDHSPPACYGVAGWDLVSEAPRDWPAAGLVHNGTEYQFCRGGLKQSTAIAVADFVLLPDGRVSRDMQAAREWADQPTRRFFGAAHLQIVCDGTLPKQDREQIVRELLAGYVPLIRVICRS